MALIDALAQDPQHAADAGQGAVELVGDRGGDLADRSHLPGLESAACP
ncbi:unnamed protein product, partial [marine sediment metagenome]